MHCYTVNKPNIMTSMTFNVIIVQVSKLAIYEDL